MDGMYVVPARLIEGFLNDMGLSPKKAMDPVAHWRLDFSFPSGQATQLSVLNPKEAPKAVVVVMGAMIDPDQQRRFADLEPDERVDFNLSLLELLNREIVEFAVQNTGPDGCPTAFQVTGTKFADGLTLDSFARTVNSTFKAYLAATLFFQRRLGTKTPSTAPLNFGFKKTSIQ